MEIEPLPPSSEHVGVDVGLEKFTALIEKSLKLRTFASAGVENPCLKWRAAKRPSDAQTSGVYLICLLVYVSLTAKIPTRVNCYAVLIKDVPERFRYERDPQDEPYLNLAIVTRADYIVSRDNDLLDLMDESRAEGQDFRVRFPMLTILDPVAFLNRIASLPSNDES